MPLSPIPIINTNGVSGVEEPQSPATSAASAAGEPLLPSPANAPLGDDAIAEIAALLAQSASDDRKQSRALNNAAEKRIAEQTKARISAMRDKADAIRTGAMVSGALGMAGGAASIAGGAAQVSSASQIKTTGTLGEVERANNDRLTQKGQGLGAVGSGASQVFQAGGTLSNGIFEAQAQEREADAVSHEQRAELATRVAAQHAQAMGDANDFAAKVSDFLKEVRSAQNSAKQAAILRA